MSKVCAMVMLGALASCGGESSIEFETLLEDDFSTFPDQWTFDGPEFRSDPDYGFPAPAGFVRGRIQLSPPAMFDYANQAIDARVTVYVGDNSSFGAQNATLKMSDVGIDGEAVARAVYTVINNRSQDSPIPGYPMGKTAEVRCYFVNGSEATVTVPYNDGAVAYDLFFTVDATGSRCGFDDTVIATDTTTSVTGSYRVVMAATGGSASTAGTVAWFDNLIVRRAD